MTKEFQQEKKAGVRAILEEILKCFCKDEIAHEDSWISLKKQWEPPPHCSRVSGAPGNTSKMNYHLFYLSCIGNCSRLLCKYDTFEKMNMFDMESRNHN